MRVRETRRPASFHRDERRDQTSRFGAPDGALRGDALMLFGRALDRRHGVAAVRADEMQDFDAVQRAALAVHVGMRATKEARTEE